MEPQNPQTQPADIKSRIQSLNQQNLTKEQIFKILLDEGFSVEQINLALMPLVQPQSGAANTSAKNVATKTSGVKAILYIAVGFIALGIASLIANNWQYLGSTFKFVMLLAIIWSVYLLGWYLESTNKEQKIGNALILLGNIVFGFSIFLIGDMFNLDSSPGNAFVLWMVGCFAMHIATQKKETFGLGILFGFFAFYFYLFTSDKSDTTLLIILGMLGALLLNYYYRNKNQHNHAEPLILLSLGFFANFVLNQASLENLILEPSQVIFLVLCLNLFYAYLYKYRSLFFFVLLGTFYWLTSFHLELSEVFRDKVIFVFALPCVLTAFIFYFLAKVFGVDKSFKGIKDIYVVCSVLAMSAVIWLLSSKSMVWSLRYYPVANYIDSYSWDRYFTFIGILLVCLFTVFHLLKVRKIKLDKIELLCALGVLVLAVFAFTVDPSSLLTSRYDQTTPYVMQNVNYMTVLEKTPAISTYGYMFLTIFNIAIIAFNVGLIFLGYHKRNELLINLGILLSFLTILNKYFDWFSDKLDRSIFFIFTGILLFGLGWALERGRKVMLRNIHNEQ